MKSRMRSPLPIFILLGIALIAIVGIMVLETSAKSAATEVNNSSRDNVSMVFYTIDNTVIYGVVVMLILIALYFVLRFFT
jgi:flagellar basal body-associated protein FliL